MSTPTTHLQTDELLPDGTNHFAPAERDWLLDTMMPDFLQLDGNWLQKQKPKQGKKRGTPGHHKLESAPVEAFYVSDHYQPDAREIDDQNKMLELLLSQSRDSWSVLKSDEAKDYRVDVAKHVDNVLRSISQLTGVEMVAYGVWVDKDKMMMFNIGTTRVWMFLDTNESNTNCEALMYHVASCIGAILGLDPEDPVATVYGAPDRNFSPRSPMIDLPMLQLARQFDVFFNSKWRWQGGQHDVPYNLLQEDSKSKTYALTNQAQYPPSILAFHNLFQMK
ncbi:hypothetical protein FS749_000879, partial [Ceratobasidium sp. UAMH 11750]